MSNLQAGNADLVTLHVYSPPLLYMGTYDLFSAARGQERMEMEFSESLRWVTPGRSLACRARGSKRA